MLENIGNIGHLGQRLGKLAHILHKGLNVADGDYSVDGQIAAQDTNGNITEVADKCMMGIIKPERNWDFHADLKRVSLYFSKVFEERSSPLKAFTTI